MAKQVAFYVQSLSDTVISVDGNPITPTQAQNMPSVDSSFFLDSYWGQDQVVLSRTINTSSSTLILINGSNQEYPCYSEDFLGQHPPHRPH